MANTKELLLAGNSTDHIWLMEDGPESHLIGVRLDCGDSGTVYFSKSQAKDLAEQLLSFAAEGDTVAATPTGCAKCGYSVHAINGGIFVHDLNGLSICPGPNPPTKEK